MDEPIKIARTAPGSDIRGRKVLEALETPFAALDRFVERWVPTSLNPFAQTGAIANTTFIIALVTGILLLFWYVPSIHDAWSSLENMGSLGEFVRSMHRYSSDACVFFVAFHAAKLFFARRFDGPRWIAWVTGLALLAMLWFVGWTGYWLVWDVRAQAVAVSTADFIEVLPIFTDPLSRTFLSNETVGTGLFFTVFFFHMLIPLAMGIALWMHISRVARPRFLTSRTMTAWVVAALVVVSVIVPATSAVPADMTANLPTFTMDWWYLLPLVITERLSVGAQWALTLTVSIAVFSIPWTLVRRTAQVAMVDPKRCNGCSLCAADCPYDAIVMVERTDGHKRWEVQARVNPERCVGCGICAGSCNPGGIGLPDMPVQDKRKVVDEWIDQILDHDEQPHIAFLCANSAGGAFFVQGDGCCRELPGYRAIGVPCSGWVHPLSVERALRRGAERVIIVGCGCSDPPFREGPKWTGERLGARRDPGLRLEKVDPDRVRFFMLQRGAEQELVQRATAFMNGELSRGPARSAASSWLGGLFASFALTAMIAGGSALGSTLPVDPSPELIVTFEQRADAVQQCRPATVEEKAAMQKHMMREEICERTRPDVHIEVQVDGQRMHREKYAPTGLSGDGPSFGTIHFTLEPGPHQVVVRVKHGASGSWKTAFDETLILARGRNSVVALSSKEGARVLK